MTNEDRARKIVDMFENMRDGRCDGNFLEDLISDAIRAECEACAKIVEGRTIKERYREWPELGPGNRSNEHETVKLCDTLAAAIRARIA